MCISIVLVTSSSPWRSTRNCFKSVRMTASAAICGMPASAARSWLRKAGSFCVSISPSRKSWPGTPTGRVPDRGEELRPFSRSCSMIRSLRSRTSSMVFLLAASFQGEDQRDSGWSDDETEEREGRCNADRDTRQVHNGGASSPQVDRPFSPPLQSPLPPEKAFQAETYAPVWADNGHLTMRTRSSREQRERVRSGPGRYLRCRCPPLCLGTVVGRVGGAARRCCLASLQKPGKGLLMCIGSEIFDFLEYPKRLQKYLRCNSAPAERSGACGASSSSAPSTLPRTPSARASSAPSGWPSGVE